MDCGEDGRWLAVAVGRVYGGFPIGFRIVFVAERRICARKWAHGDAPGASLGPIWAPISAGEALSRGLWGVPGVPGGFAGGPWGSLKDPWGSWRGAWGPRWLQDRSHDPTWANLGPTWGQLGASLESTWANLGPTWGQMDQKLVPKWSKTAPIKASLMKHRF